MGYLKEVNIIKLRYACCKPPEEIKNVYRK